MYSHSLRNRVKALSRTFEGAVLLFALLGSSCENDGDDPATSTRETEINNWSLDRRRIALVGKSTFIKREEFIVITRDDGPIGLASKWTDEYGSSYQLETTLDEHQWTSICRELHRLLGTKYVEPAKPRHALSWNIDVTSYAPIRHLTLSCIDESDSSPLSTFVSHVLQVRNTRLAFSVPVEESPMDFNCPEPEAKPPATLLIDQIAESLAAGLDNSAAIADILKCGRHRNKSIVDALITLLDSGSKPSIGAACASLSWISGLPPSEEAPKWRDWWRVAKVTWNPSIKIYSRNMSNGVLRVLGRAAAGLSLLDMDGTGRIWGGLHTRHAVARHRYI
jgi:hypothetical protein